MQKRQNVGHEKQDRCQTATNQSASSEYAAAGWRTILQLNRHPSPMRALGGENQKLSLTRSLPAIVANDCRICRLIDLLTGRWEPSAMPNITTSGWTLPKPRIKY